MRRFALTLGIFAMASSEAAAQHASDLYQRVVSHLEVIEDDLIAVRRDIHRHPELSGNETRTAGIVADRLRELGIDVRTGVGGHGVVGVLVGGHPGPVVAFRADMDAVESSFPDPVEFASTVPGVRHICGHDIHTTTGLAIAEGLASIREDLRGTIMFVFQPAEETATGARAMLADDVWGETRPDAIYAYHTAPFNVGQIATAQSTLLAGRDRVRVTIAGSGDKAAAAERIRELIRSVGTIPPEEALVSVSTDDFALVWIGSPSPNESGEFEVNATITTTPVGRERVKETIETGLEAFAAEDVSVAHAYEEKWIAGVNNDPGIVDRANAAATEVLGPEAVIEVQGIPPAFSEDFGSFQDEVPGAMYFLGVSNPEKGWVGMPHTPEYVADEGAILVGASAMSAILLDFLDQGGDEAADKEDPEATDANAITGFRLVREDGRVYVFEVDYSMASSHTAPIHLGARLHGWEGEPFGEYEATELESAEVGKAEIEVTLPESLRDALEVEFFLYEAGAAPFVTERFLFDRVVGR